MRAASTAAGGLAAAECATRTASSNAIPRWMFMSSPRTNGLPQQVEEGALACGGKGYHPRVPGSPGPAELADPGEEIGTQRPAQMMPALPPVHARPAERAALP